LFIFHVPLSFASSAVILFTLWINHTAINYIARYFLLSSSSLFRRFTLVAVKVCEPGGARAEAKAEAPPWAGTTGIFTTGRVAAVGMLTTTFGIAELITSIMANSTGKKRKSHERFPNFAKDGLTRTYFAERNTQPRG
jgi:hypothetical protein